MGNKNSVEDINRKKPPESKLKAVRLMPTIYNDNGKSYTTVSCACECGKVKTYIVSAVLRGGTISCGCSKIGPKPSRRSKYPLHLRKVYQAIIDRCYNVKDISFPTYGKRGVKVCKEWRNDLSLFCEWALANGWEKGLQVDKDIKGNGMLYSPETCSIVTARKNSNNRRDNKKYPYKGEMLTIPEISRRVGKVDSHVLSNWKTYGHFKMVHLPLKRKGKKFKFKGRMMTLSEIADLHGISRGVLSNRVLCRKWPLKLAIIKPIIKR